MTTNTVNKTVSTSIIEAAMLDACSKIAPLWPLESVVAVNPFMGYTSTSFANASKEISATSEIKTTMPLSYYLDKLEDGSISEQQIEAVLKGHKHTSTAQEFISSLEAEDKDRTAQISSITDIASNETDLEWNRIMIERIAQWAASYFDKGQAAWSASFKEDDIYLSWKQEAVIDRSIDVLGFPQFRKNIAALPSEVDELLSLASSFLELPDSEATTLYFQRLLRTINGWSSFIAYLDWEDQLKNLETTKLREFLAVLLSWEVALYQTIGYDSIRPNWHHTLNKLTNKEKFQDVTAESNAEFILQKALDLSAQELLINKLSDKKTSIANNQKLKAQAVFCIDVRSEVFRRNLEKDGGFQTLGFAGFFGFPIEFLQAAAEKADAQCPVLLHPSYTIKEEYNNKLGTDLISNKRMDRNQVKKTLKAFKSGAVSCFSFVSPVGLSFLPKLVSDSMNLTRTVDHPRHIGVDKYLRSTSTVSVNSENNESINYGIPFADQVTLAKNALIGMSLTKDFAPYVMFVGHGSSSVNNPHASGYDCGACGGHTGEANAKVAAKILNDPAIRTGLKNEGIEIPDSTTFLACLHDTTTDEVTIFESEFANDLNVSEIADIKNSLRMAGMLCRSERSSRMGINGHVDKEIMKRSKDWAQVRPEWGLAGCSSFIIAPRELTKNIDLGGRSFLHSYSWKQDTDFNVLEQIMTAPMVVTSWINLQYYASAVDNQNLGAGNKTLHNVTGGLGVIEGSSGDLRVGLPWQSVHDGQEYQHNSVKLTVVINAPTEAISAVLHKHPSIKDLFDNDWIYLMAMDDNGAISHRYLKDLRWKEIQSKSA